jgi:serine/threonine protein phosphatase PrpC
MAEVSSAAITHTGLRRESNEDAFRDRPDLGLYVVADGMGGHEAGEVASGLTVQTIESFINDTRHADLNQTWPFPYETSRSLEANRLIAAFRLANRRVASGIAGDPALKGMATTAAAVLLGKDGHAHLAHVGDSRVYLLRDNRLQQLTHDHSWVGEQVRAGLLTDEDAQRHPWRNVVTRAISGADDPEVETADVTTQSGDLLMICSDGLSSVVSLEEIEKILTNRTLDRGPAFAEATAGKPLNLGPLAAALIDAANKAGGPDNITVILVLVQ